MDLYDALIVGGGPAGLSAAVYLGRFTRRVLVLDAGGGRSSLDQVNENYLGFPEGVSARALRALGRAQAERFGVRFQACRVRRLERVGPHFRARTTAGEFEGRTLLLATGVRDVWPDVPGVGAWVGRQVFWCITCDGYRARDRAVVCLGNTDEAATTALQLQLFTPSITLVADPDAVRISGGKQDALAAHGVPLLLGRPAALELSAHGDAITAVLLSDGTRLACELVFSLLGVRPDTRLARALGLAVDAEGYVVIGVDGRTSLPGAFAAGDLTDLHTQQVASAVHAGAEAAQSMNYFLYADYQKNSEEVPARDEFP